MPVKKLSQWLYLVLLDIDEEMIGGIRRQAGAPILQQVIPDQCQREQSHEAQPQGSRLHYAGGGSPPDARQAVAPGAARLSTHMRQRFYQA